MEIKQKISIVIPVFNTPVDVLRKCILSVLNQTYVYIEVILVDDGSTSEDTKNTLWYFNAYDKRVKVILKQNSGVAATRNTGIKESTGDFIMFVDSDDTIKERACEKLISNMTENVSLAICGYYMNDSECEENDSLDFWNVDEIRKLKFDILAFKTGKYDVAVDSPWGKLFNARIIHENEIIFPENLTRSEDALFMLRYLDHVESICVLHSKFYFYRDNPSSLSRKFTKNPVDILPIILKEEKSYVEQFCNSDAYLLEACNLRVVNGILEAEENYFFNTQNMSAFYDGYTEFVNFLKEDEISFALKSLSKQKYFSVKDAIRAAILNSSLVFAYYSVKYFRNCYRKRKQMREI